MKAIERRIAKLETGGNGMDSLMVRRWLGLPLTEVQHAQADFEAVNHTPPSAATVAAMSPKAKEWLGL